MKILAVFLFVLALAMGTPTANVPFSTNLFTEITQSNRDGDVVFSPASINSCLGLAYMGAEGDTAKELYDTLQLKGSNKEETAASFGEYFNKVKGSGAELKTANRVYLADRYSLAPSYEALTAKYFDSQAEKVNFADAATADKMNSWVSEKTNQKIKQLIEPNGLDATTSAVLINAIYFKATWQYEFDKEDTVNKDFHKSLNRVKPVQMMMNSVKLSYGEFADLDAAGVEIPYDKTDIHMFVLLPNKVDGLAALEEKLKGVDVTKLHTSPTKVNLQLPKFKIEFSVSLNNVLKNLGLNHMFENADFSGMTGSKDPLSVSDVVHKAFIEVDEKGTEAAAATGIFMSRTLPSPRDLPIDFIVDHPFVFVIKDNDTVYFAGHVTM